MDLWLWIVAVWLGCIAVMAVLERVLARSGRGVLSNEDRTLTVLAYVLVLIVLSPVGVIVVLGMVIVAVPVHLWRFAMRDPDDPEKRRRGEWYSQGPDSFVADLVRRRKKHDRRLEGEDIGDWMMYRFDHTPEAMILDVVSKYSSLHEAGVPDNDIWERLEANRYEWGEGRLPVPCDLNTYVEYRLGIEDPGYLDLRSGFVHEQIAHCQTYAHRRSQREAERAWPPVEWHQRRISLSEFEKSQGDGLDPIADGAPAVLSFGGDDWRLSLLSFFKCVMVPGDELWTFSSPPETWAGLAGRGGVVLVRNGRPLRHFVTMKN